LALDGCQLLLAEALLAEACAVDVGRALECGGADAVPLDLLDLVPGVAQAAQGEGDGAVDDLEVPAAGELLELDEGEVGLDARGITVHDEADGARGRDNRDLGIPEAMLLTHHQRSVPRLAGGVNEGGWRGAGIKRPRQDAEVLILFGGRAVGSPQMVTHDS